MNAPRRSLAIIGLVLSASAVAGAADEERVTRSAAGPVRERAADELRDPQTFELSERKAADIAHKPRASSTSGRKTAASVSYGDSWIYDASTVLFSDYDNDGYFRYLRVRFDADTIYSSTYVYAEIYLSADGNAWEHLYSTDDFLIWGTDPDDDYEVETELVSGYSTGLYDVLIELYDADTGELVDEYGPDESSDFSLLPLEDSARDGLVAPLPGSHSHGGGGALSWLTLPGLLGAWAYRRRRA
jgi:hypothetical protein